MYTVQAVSVPQNIMQNFDLLSTGLRDQVIKEWANCNVYQPGDVVEFVYQSHGYIGRKGTVISIIKMYGGAQDWVMIEEDKTHVVFSAAMWQLKLIDPPKQPKHELTRITIEEFNAKVASAERFTRIDSQNTKTRNGTYYGSYYSLYTGLNCTTWFVGLALDEKSLQIIVERVG